MIEFLRVAWAECRKQHVHHFHSWGLYFSTFVWPVMAFTTVYLMYQPFMGAKSTDTLSPYWGERTTLLGNLVIGYLGFILFFAGIQAAWRFSHERFAGTLEMIILSPANRLAVVLGNAMASLLESAWLFAAFTVVLLASGVAGIIQLQWLILGIAALLLSAACWAAFLNSLFLATRDPGILFTLLQAPLEFLSGVRYPFAALPLVLQIVGWLLPLTFSLAVARRSIPGAGLPVGWALVITLIFSTLLLVGTLTILAFSERRAKRQGSLVLF